jgi:hypothetical protein
MILLPIIWLVVFFGGALASAVGSHCSRAPWPDTNTTNSGQNGIYVDGQALWTHFDTDLRSTTTRLGSIPAHSRTPSGRFSAFQPANV